MCAGNQYDWLSWSAVAKLQPELALDHRASGIESFIAKRAALIYSRSTAESHLRFASEIQFEESS